MNNAQLIAVDYHQKLPCYADYYNMKKCNKFEIEFTAKSGNLPSHTACYATQIWIYCILMLLHCVIQCILNENNVGDFQKSKQCKPQCKQQNYLQLSFVPSISSEVSSLVITYCRKDQNQNKTNRIFIAKVYSGS